ncbi:MAG TPA: transketolase [Feifaniaceae bacterium]|nr:transketolase [Feifaniaceae bacterium]
MNAKKELIANIEHKARLMRKHSLDMALVAGSNGAHLGPGNSMSDIMATLYFGVMRHDPKNPLDPDRDRFILSKGHGVLGYYTALAEAGYFPVELLKTFETDDSPLAGHPSIHRELGIEYSTGSLGHGLSIGVGSALGAKRANKGFLTYVYMGDGETNEGTVWEAAMSAAHLGLDNLIGIVDRNLLQSDGLSRNIVDMGDMAEKWRAFGWHVAEVDGHDVPALLDAFEERQRPKNKPYVIVAHTIKGKGVSFFENDNKWHHAKLTRQQYVDALFELGFDGNGEELR